jgi:predicted amidohydrolase YtcJ
LGQYPEWFAHNTGIPGFAFELYSRSSSQLARFEPGKSAGFVLSDDPFAIAQDKITDLQIVRTVVSGSPVFHA